jgi:hypothetical protein
VYKNTLAVDSNPPIFVQKVDAMATVRHAAMPGRFESLFCHVPMAQQ